MEQDRIQMLLEAERRGILPEKYKAPLAEARRRGLVPRVETNLVEQAGNGLNEGLAATLGAPVDLLTTGINMGTGGINRATGSNIPPITNPVGGSQSFVKLLGGVGAITDAEPQTTAQRYTRSIAREGGALAIPGAATVAKANKAAPVLGGFTASTLGAGTGAQAASDATGGNATAEALGGLLGGLSPLAATRITRPPAPTMEELRQVETQGYGTVNQSTARLSPEIASKLADDIEGAFGKRSAAARKMNPKAAVAAKAIADDLRRNPPTITEVEEARRWIGQNVAGSTDLGERAIGVQMKQRIDAFLDGLQPNDLTGSNDAQGLVNNLKTARNATKRRKKAELIEAEDTGLVDRGINRAATTGTGGNELNAIRQNVRRILDNPKERRKFEDWELPAMRDIVKGTPTQNGLRILSRLAPSAGALPLSGAGAAVATSSLTGNPLFLVPPALGEFGRLGGDAMLRSQVNGLGDLLRNGQPIVRRQSPSQQGLLGALLAAQGAQAVPQP